MTPADRRSDAQELLEHLGRIVYHALVRESHGELFPGFASEIEAAVKDLPPREVGPAVMRMLSEAAP